MKIIRKENPEVLSPSEGITLSPGAEWDPLSNGMAILDVVPKIAGTSVFHQCDIDEVLEAESWNGRSVADKCGDGVPGYDPQAYIEYTKCPCYANNYCRQAASMTAFHTPTFGYIGKEVRFTVVEQTTTGKKGALADTIEFVDGEPLFGVGWPARFDERTKFLPRLSTDPVTAATRVRALRGSADLSWDQLCRNIGELKDLPETVTSVLEFCAWLRNPSLAKVKDISCGNAAKAYLAWKFGVEPTPEQFGSFAAALGKAEDDIRSWSAQLTRLTEEAFYEHCDHNERIFDEIQACERRWADEDKQRALRRQRSADRRERDRKAYERQKEFRANVAALRMDYPFVKLQSRASRREAAIRSLDLRLQQARQNGSDEAIARLKSERKALKQSLTDIKSQLRKLVKERREVRYDEWIGKDQFNALYGRRGYDPSINRRLQELTDTIEALREDKAEAYHALTTNHFELESEKFNAWRDAQDSWEAIVDEFRTEMDDIAQGKYDPPFPEMPEWPFPKGKRRSGQSEPGLDNRTSDKLRAKRRAAKVSYLKSLLRPMVVTLKQHCCANTARTKRPLGIQTDAYSPPLGSSDLDDIVVTRRWENGRWLDPPTGPRFITALGEQCSHGFYPLFRRDVLFGQVDLSKQLRLFLDGMVNDVIAFLQPFQTAWELRPMSFVLDWFASCKPIFERLENSLMAWSNPDLMDGIWRATCVDTAIGSSLWQSASVKTEIVDAVEWEGIPFKAYTAFTVKETYSCVSIDTAFYPMRGHFFLRRSFDYSPGELVIPRPSISSFGWGKLLSLAALWKGGALGTHRVRKTRQALKGRRPRVSGTNKPKRKQKQ